MAFSSKEWKNGSGGGTPTNAAGWNDQEARIKAALELIDLNSNWGSGDLLGVRVTTPPGAHKFDLRDGTAASPVKIGVTASISRTDATTRAEVNAMGPEGTDGPDGASILRLSIKGATTNEVQICSLVARAWQTSTYAEVGNDATPIFAAARVSGSGTGRAIPIYAEAVRETATSRGQQGIEIRIKNESGEEDSYLPGTAPKSMGIWLNAQGASKAASGFTIGHNYSQAFDVGYSAQEGSIVSAFMRDDSTALRSIFIKNAHEKGAIVVNKGAGQVIIGREEAQQTTPLLEVFSESGLDPIISFGSNTGASHRAQLIRNSTGNLGAFASNITNGFLTGTVQGDTGLTFTAGKTFHVGAATKTSQFRITESGIGFFGTTPISKPTVTGAKAGNVALESLVTQLAALGLITNSTT